MATQTSSATITDRVIKIIKALPGMEDADVHAGSDLDKHLGLDSLDRMELWMFVDQEFGEDIPGHVAAKFDTVQDIVNYLDRERLEPNWDIKG
jgi:acyl carrier protein